MSIKQENNTCLSFAFIDWEEKKIITTRRYYLPFSSSHSIYRDNGRKKKKKREDILARHDNILSNRYICVLTRGESDTKTILCPIVLLKRKKKWAKMKNKILIIYHP